MSRKKEVVYVSGPITIEVIRTLFGQKVIIKDLTKPSPKKAGK